MGFYEMLWGAENLVPAKYWYPYGTHINLKLYYHKGIVQYYMYYLDFLQIIYTYQT